MCMTLCFYQLAASVDDHTCHCISTKSLHFSHTSIVLCRKHSRSDMYIPQLISNCSGELGHPIYMCHQRSMALSLTIMHDMLPLIYYPVAAH